MSYFKNLFTAIDGNREETVTYALSPMVTEEDNEALISLPSFSKIKEAVFSIQADKAPGPNGFSVGFFHTHWAEIGEDISKEIQGIFEAEIIPPRINETHIRLIPKVHSPKAVAEYIPIALYNVYYKSSRRS